MAPYGATKKSIDIQIKFHTIDQKLVSWYFKYKKKPKKPIKPIIKKKKIKLPKGLSLLQ